MSRTVALVSPLYAPAVGGVERVVEMQARELSRRGVEVEVITTDPAGTLPGIEARDGINVRRFPTVAHDSIYFVSPRLGAHLWRHADRYAVLHAHSYHSALAFQAAIAARRAGVPLIVSTYYHGTGHTRLRRLLHGPYRPVGRWILATASFVVCGSAAEGQLVRRHFGSATPVVVVVNGIDTDELNAVRLTPSARSAPAPLQVLAVGRLEAYKHMERLLTALASLPEGSSLTIVGDGPERGALERLAAELGIHGRVRLLGHQSRAALLDLYANADVFVSVSRQESFGLAVLEAAVAGLPVVASDIPSHREVTGFVGQGRAILVPLTDQPAQLAESLLAAAARGRALDVAGWSVPTWGGHVDQLLGYYRSALRGGGSNLPLEVPA